MCTVNYQDNVLVQHGNVIVDDNSLSLILFLLSDIETDVRSPRFPQTTTRSVHFIFAKLFHR